jgi:hypothetical protein
MPFRKVFDAGQRLFVTDFNACDGAGLPGTNGGIAPRTPDPAEGPRFTRISAPDANSCAGCHNQPQSGGADGAVDTSAVAGVDPDLIIKPFSRKGAMRSVREFTAGADPTSSTSTTSRKLANSPSLSSTMV